MRPRALPLRIHRAISLLLLAALCAVASACGDADVRVDERAGMASVATTDSVAATPSPDSGVAARPVDTASPAAAATPGVRDSLATASPGSSTTPVDTMSASDSTETHQPNATAGVTQPDGQLFDGLLSRAVANGRVDYSVFRNNPRFGTYLEQLAAADVTTMSPNEQLAFWINSYNALTIRNVLDNPAMKRPIDVKGFFDATTFRVAGRTMTLNEIENDVIRPRFHDPLVHFGLVCAARSCPPLRPSAYTAAHVRARLAENARDYLASEYNHYDPTTNTLRLSQIFDWYREDFGGSETDLRAFAKKYGPPSWKDAINDHTLIEFIDYDWRLNAQ